MSSSQHFEFTFTEHLMKKYIGKLKIGCSPGSDGVTAEHIKYAINSDIVIHLCRLFTVCFQYGVVPFSFTQGILVPLLKKLDPTVPNNYRPVIVSNILSKIMELYILDECGGYTFNDSQFGFIQGRSTNDAISLAHDVASYCIFNGSPVFMCGLDAEGAFDAIPHPVLFDKAADIITDMSWNLLYTWYGKITVRIKWNKLGKEIKMYKGTRQGGLTS